MIEFSGNRQADLILRQPSPNWFAPIHAPNCQVYWARAVASVLP